MRNDFQDNNQVQIEKAKKNLVYVGIFSIVMLFAGFTSAYIVSMGDSFWLKFPLPNAFYISTAVIILSSIVLQVSISVAKKGNMSLAKILIVSTFLLGAGFVYMQFKGYGQLVDNGVYAVNNHIIVTDGKYGDYFEVKMDGKFIEVNGNDYLIAGKKMSEKDMKDFQAFMSQFHNVAKKKQFEVSEYGDRFEIYFENRPLYRDGTALMTADSTELKYLDRVRLRDLAWNVRDGRGDFFVRGDLGKEFHIYYKNQELSYKDRELRLGNKKLSNYLQIKAMESADTASSYLYVITFLHLLHVVVALFYMLRLVIRSFSGKINSENTLSLRLGAIFWHFLGILWVYLLLFLLFIH